MKWLLEILRLRRKRLWAIEGPYSAVFNVDDDLLRYHRTLAEHHPTRCPHKVRPMTDDEMREWA